MSTPDKELNILMTPSYINTHRSYKLLKMARFLAHTSTEM